MRVAVKGCFLIATVALFATRGSHAAFLEANKAVLRGVDKITGRVRTIELPVGALGQFGNLTIYVEKCLTRPPEETPENTAFLMITQPQGGHEHQVVFNGWMFSSNPAISAMEHPIYDIWVISCPVDETARLTELKEKDAEHRLAEEKTKQAASMSHVPQELSDIEKEMLARAQNRLFLMRQLSEKKDTPPMQKRGQMPLLPVSDKETNTDVTTSEPHADKQFMPALEEAITPPKTLMQQNVPLPHAQKFQGVHVPNVTIESLEDDISAADSADTGSEEF